MIRERVGGEYRRTQRLDDPLARDRIEARGRIADADQRLRHVARHELRTGTLETGRSRWRGACHGGADMVRRLERTHPSVMRSKVETPHDIGIAHECDDAAAARQRSRV